MLRLLESAACPGSFVVGLLVATAGCEPANDAAATPPPGCDCVLTDHVLESDRPIYVDLAESRTVADACAKTVMDAHAILKHSCGHCHDAGRASRGSPIFDFILDDDRLKNTLWTLPGQPPLPFASPGNPRESVIFIRAAVSRDMPPLAQAPGDPPEEPRVSYSAASVLYQWIKICM